MKSSTDLETRVIECAVRQISLDIGKGNRLVLFKGDHINISIDTSIRKRYRVVSGSGQIIGYVTNRDIRCIAGQPAQRRGRHALAKK
jgi:hypothetical protein